MITRDELFEALDDACAIAHEWDGGPLEEKLRALGLDKDDVHELLQERLQAYRDYYRERQESELPRHELFFVHGFLEALMTGYRLGRKQRDE